MSWSDDPPEDQLDDPEIREILDQGVSDTIEFVLGIPDNPEDFAKEAVGLANHRGGVILIGVSETGELVGLDDPRMVLDETANILEKFVEPSLKYTMQTQSIEQKKVISVRIKLFDNLPFAMNRTFYIRKSHSSYPLPPVDVLGLMKRSQQYGED